MDGMDRLNALHLNDDKILDNYVYPIPKLDFFTVVNDRQTDLASHVKPALAHFVFEAGLVYALSSSPGPSSQWTCIAAKMMEPVIWFIRRLRIAGAVATSTA
jgi:hypothetical protein